MKFFSTAILFVMPFTARADQVVSGGDNNGQPMEGINNNKDLTNDVEARFDTEVRNLSGTYYEMECAFYNTNA